VAFMQGIGFMSPALPLVVGPAAEPERQLPARLDASCRLRPALMGVTLRFARHATRKSGNNLNSRRLTECCAAGARFPQRIPASPE
jgi:hypothetical protein